MIYLDESIGQASPSLMDFGIVQRSQGATDYIPRKGSRFMVSCSYGPYYPSKARSVIAKLIAGKRKGIRIAYPLLESQGAPGLPVVDGTPSGHELTLRGVTAGYVCREGYWLSIEDENGQHYLHNVEVGGRADAAGELTISVNPELRVPFADGDSVHLAKPFVEGIVQGDEWGWELSVNRVVPIQFAIEERA